MADNDPEVIEVRGEKCSEADANLLAACAAFDEYAAKKAELDAACVANGSACNAMHAALGAEQQAEKALNSAVKALGGALIYKGHVVVAEGDEKYPTTVIAKHFPDTIYSADKDAK